MFDFFEGKKTYATALVTGIVAAAQVMGYDIPPYVLTLLGAFGLYSLRSAVDKSIY